MNVLKKEKKKKGNKQTNKQTKTLVKIIPQQLKTCQMIPASHKQSIDAVSVHNFYRKSSASPASKKQKIQR